LGQLTYARWIIEETMRMYPALWFFTRQAIDQDVLGEYVVPARTEIFISPYVIQRRDDLWPEPDQFIPERFDPAMVRHPMAFIPFSAGPRNCIGEHLARWEMLIHLSMIARKLRLRYLGDQPEYDVGINLRTKDDLWMLPIVVN
jgi:cytochrome P450